MKQILLLMTVLFAMSINAQITDCSDLFFSEYVEGSSQNKAIEVYNPTDAPIDLSNYTIERYSNGATNNSGGGVTNLTGMLASGDAFVLTNGDTDISSLFGYIDPVLFSIGDMAEPVGSFPTPMHMNGNDAMVLMKNGVIIDVIGKVGQDPGAAWTDDASAGYTDANGGAWWTANHTLIRKSIVLSGDNDGLDLFNPSLEWDSLSIGTWSNLGSHTCNCFTSTPTWDCDGQGNCSDPGTGNGTYASLTSCQSNCVVVTTYGCTDPTASNYDPNANNDDGSCIYCDVSFNTPIYQSSSSNTTCDGYILTSATSSYLPITYSWNNGVSGANNLNLCTGIYSVTATDAVGCSITDTFIIGQIVFGCTNTLAFNYDSLANIDDGSCYYCDISITTTATQNPTAGLCNGLIMVNATSSYSPLTYSWNSGTINNILTSLCTGIYLLTVTDALGCVATQTFTLGTIIYGCTDPLATNYDVLATVDDGTCTYTSTCTSPSPTGAYTSALIHDRVTITWDNMNDANCMIEQYRIRYREVGTSAWLSKTMSSTIARSACS